MIVDVLADSAQIKSIEQYSRAICYEFNALSAKSIAPTQREKKPTNPASRRCKLAAMDPAGVKMAGVIGAVVFALGCILSVILPIETAARIAFAMISTIGLIVSMLVLFQASFRGSSEIRREAFSPAEQMAREERFIRDALGIDEDDQGKS